MDINREIQAKIRRYFPDYQHFSKINQAIIETETAFQSFPISQRFKKSHNIKPHVRAKSDFSFIAPALLSQEGQIITEFTKLLMDKLVELRARTKKVNVLDYGADPTGIKDSTLAFQKAILRGNRTVIIPPGKYNVRALRLPSFTELIGSGSEKTMLIMDEREPKRHSFIRNRHLLRGDESIVIAGLTLDWRVERFTKNEKTATGGIHSSGITLAHVRYAKVQDVKVLNPGLHGVDVTAAYYSYSGDGTRSRFGSCYIWIDRVEASGFGDDGITTHHSEYILISNSYLHNPSGRSHRQGFSNSNGIEVDDGSEHVILVNNFTKECFGGVEIKAHETSSAASDTQIIGHFSERDNRSFNFRHIGHHQKTDKGTCTALGIRATFLVALESIWTPLYVDSKPRALVISAYHNVVINHLFSNAAKLAVQYLAKNVKLIDVNGPLMITKTTENVLQKNASD